MSELTYPKLRGIMAEHGISQSNMAERLGISQQAMTKKMNNKTAFSQKDMVRICEILDIPIADVGLYFFY